MVTVLKLPNESNYKKIMSVPVCTVLLAAMNLIEFLCI